MSHKSNEMRSGGIVINLLAISAVVLEQAISTTAKVWYYDDNAPSLDNCDYLKWRTCNNLDSDDCEWETWKDATFAGEGTSVPMWESIESYGNFHRYECASPAEMHDMEGCNAYRCIPVLKSAFACQENEHCYDGQVCFKDENNAEDGYCISCHTIDEDHEQHANPARYFAEGACHQVQTFGGGGTPPFEEGESGCAGDHCHHTCTYDTKCVRIQSDTAYIDLTATHNQLPGILNLTEDDREHLMRPSICGGDNAGADDSGMRCASSVHRTITSNIRTPEEVRHRDLDVVELSVMKLGGDNAYENWVKFDEDDIEKRALFNEEGGRGYSIGYPIPSDAKTAEGKTVGTGVLAWGLENWSHHHTQGLVQCDVRYAEDVPLHAQIKNGIDVDTVPKRSTLLTRVCVRFEQEGDEGGADSNTQQHTWGDHLVFQHEVRDEDYDCGEWGTTSDPGNRFPFRIKCSLSGPSVRGVVPTEAQREEIRGGLRAAFASNTLHAPEVLRASFHDEASYTPDDTAVLGGARGCMRFEHVQGNGPNVGLAFLFDHLNEAVGCAVGVYTSGPDWCWSMADILQYAGATAVEIANGPSFSSNVKWGRTDAPFLFCAGELQLTMPDAKGGHKEGAILVGSSDVPRRLQTVFDATKTYFEQQLNLTNQEWVAYLGGGHSIGGVKGLNQAMNTRFNFDTTPELFDNLYFGRIDRAKNTSLMSLCPQMKKMGSSHFWEPSDLTKPDEGGGLWQTLIDTDVSLTMDDATMEHIRVFAHNEALFFGTFVEAFLKVSELGYGDSLVTVPTIASPTSAPVTQNPTISPTGMSVPTPTPTAVPSHLPTEAPTASPTVAPITTAPIEAPTASPSVTPITTAPTEAPTASPTVTPITTAPTETPTASPTVAPITTAPTEAPTASPTVAPITTAPTETPTASPSVAPITTAPTEAPTASPTVAPITTAPTKSPTQDSFHKTYEDVGYCNSETDIGISSGSISTANECLEECKSKYSSSRDTLFIEWFEGECFCQQTCPCLDDISSTPRTIMAPNDFVLPESCDRKYWVVCGRKRKCKSSEPDKAYSVTAKHEVRCCSDEAKPGWTKRNRCNVWAESKFDNIFDGKSECFSSKTHGEASAICANSDARLCTRTELRKNCARGTGCGHDNDLIWSSTVA